MSEQIDPVAEVPEASALVSDDEAVANEASDPATTERSLSKRQWPWFVVLGVAAITGLTGYALGHTNGEGNHRQQPVGLNGPVQGGPNGGLGFGQDGDHRNGGGKHGQPGPQLPGQQGVPGQPGMPGQPGQQLPGGPGFGPHCEDTTGAHAPVSADGSCPTGFTLDDKGPGQKMVPNTPLAPNASPSTSTSPTS